MSYNYKRWMPESKRYIIDYKYHSQRCQSKKTKNTERRIAKQQKTSVYQEKINLRHRIDKLTKLILNNFKKDDLWVTFTIADDVSYKEHKEEYEKAMRKLRSFFKKMGMELKYIAVHENIEGKGRLHGHMLIPSWGADIPETKEILEKFWTLGACDIRMYEGKFGDAQRLASYITKEKTVLSKLDEQTKLIAEYKKRGETDIDRLMKIRQEIDSLRSNICTSKNLVRTKEKKEIITRADTFSDKICAPKGYHILHEFSHSWFTEDGYKHQYIVFEADDVEPLNTR